jgi:transposase-like protein
LLEKGRCSVFITAYVVFFYVRYGVSYRDLVLEKGRCSVFITSLRQHEIKRITLTINGSV